MLIALDGAGQRRKIFAYEEATPPFFCQVCGNEVEPSKTDDGMPYWKHKEEPCTQWEPDTSEHLKMKNILINRLPSRLKPQLEFPILSTVSDILLPDLKVNIECQVSPQTIPNIKKRLWKLSRLGYFTIWIWYQRDYAKIIELGRQQTYHKLNSRLIESTILSQFFTEDEERPSSKAFWEDHQQAMRNDYAPRYFTFFKNGCFYWLNIIRRYGNKFYSGALREFDFTDIGVELYKTDIGRLGAFIKEKRGDTQQKLRGI